MKKALIVLAAVAACASTFAQSSTVIFKNRTIATPDPNTIPGGNNNGSFNVPIYQFGTTTGAGSLPGGVTVGLFYNDNLLGTALLGTSGAGAAFFVTPPNQELQIKDAAGVVAPPGSTPLLTVRAWTTESGSFAQAKTDVTGNIGQWGEWTFNAPPISGAGSPPSTPPDLTGWGALDGHNYGNQGFALNLAPEPSTIALGVLGIGALVLARRRK